MSFWRAIVIVFILVEISQELNIRYEELTILNVSCYPYDTCNAERENMERQLSRCKCDNSCVYYGDCCLDAPNSYLMKNLQIRINTCLKVNRLESYFVVSLCKSTWKKVTTKRKCEGNPIAEDPYTLIPVTNQRRKITYKNRYCAECHEDDGHLNFWRLGVSCSKWNFSLEYDIENNLTYNYRLKTWGIQLPNKEFVNCNLEPVAPKYTQLLRSCIPDVQSTCPVTWKDNLVKEKCESYTAVIEGYNGKYRNVHCAICNGIDIKRYSCIIDSAYKLSRGFQRIFDIDVNDDKCEGEQVWDEKFKRCRKFGCSLPFQILKNGRCVPKS